jgi:glutamate/tyrosine decarboxylase-like PLP-dependent enzyme
MEKTSDFMQELEKRLKPYKDLSPAFKTIPERGIGKDKILQELEKLKKLEEKKWKEGYASGAVYHGGDEHIAFLNQVYSMYSQSNPLHPDIWPSMVKFESEIVSMVSHLLSGKKTCGCVTSGGTESILLAVKAYRDLARKRKGIKSPEMILPVTAHVAFDKASQYFGIKTVYVPVDSKYEADVNAVGHAITENTILIVGSAPCFPYGTIDPIEKLSTLAMENKIGCHVDACLGGFILPWAEKLGYDVPPFDFRLPGVTSISVDTHKYGFSPKGTSVILYRNPQLRHYQYYTATDWPGGLYASPTIPGSRAGGLIATCWAALLSMGENGYMEATKKILETAVRIKSGIAEIPELYILGNPLWVIAFSSKSLNIYQIMEYMTKIGWNLNGLQKPPAVHIAITLRHTQSGVAERFLRDLKSAVGYVKEHPKEQIGLAPVYGMASTLPRDVVSTMLKTYLDNIYKV